MKGKARIKACEFGCGTGQHVVDFDKSPEVPEGWTILPDSEQLPNRVRGMVTVTTNTVRFHWDDCQNDGCIKGKDLRKKLERQWVYGDQLLNFYLANSQFIPEEWKNQRIYFWGVIYRSGCGGFYVRHLWWDARGQKWSWNYGWFEDYWRNNQPAAVSPLGCFIPEHCVSCTD